MNRAYTVCREALRMAVLGVAIGGMMLAYEVWWKLRDVGRAVAQCLRDLNR